MIFQPDRQGRDATEQDIADMPLGAWLGVAIFLLALFALRDFLPDDYADAVVTQAMVTQVNEAMR